MEEFRICQTCKYARGFHTTFKKQDNKTKTIFICPNCGSAYDLDIIEERIKDINPRKVAQYEEK